MRTEQRQDPARWVLTALLAAMTCVATLVIRVPSPTNGYLNLGDSMVLLGAYLLGPVYGALAGGLGSALADLLAGYPLYIPGTLVIKAAMAALAGTLYRREGGLGRLLLCALAAESVMTAGYCLYESLLYGGLAAGAVGVPANLVQGAFGMAASTLLTLALRRSGAARALLRRL